MDCCVSCPGRGEGGCTPTSQAPDGGRGVRGEEEEWRVTSHIAPYNGLWLLVSSSPDGKHHQVRSHTPIFPAAVFPALHTHGRAHGGLAPHHWPWRGKVFLIGSSPASHQWGSWESPGEGICKKPRASTRLCLGGLLGCLWFSQYSKARTVNRFFVIGGKDGYFLFCTGAQRRFCRMLLKGGSAGSPGFWDLSGFPSVFCLPVSKPTTLAHPTGGHAVRADA